MSFQRLLQVISVPPGASFHQLEELSRINPSRFYVENVRALFGVTTGAAKQYCETAVRNGLVRKRIGIECPNDDRIMASYYSESEIPETIVCDLCEAAGEELFEFKTADCKRIEFYEFKK